MEIRTSSLLAVGQGFSPNVASNNSNESSRKPSSTQVSSGNESNVVDQVDVGSDVRIAADEISSLQIGEQKIKTESPEVISQLEVAASNVEEIIYNNSIKSADIATKILGNSADITV